MKSLDYIALELERKDAFYQWLEHANRMSVPEDDSVFPGDHSIYMVKPLYNKAEVNAFMEENYMKIWEHELNMWHVQELWPANRSYDEFRNWYEIKIHREVIEVMDGE